MGKYEWLLYVALAGLAWGTYVPIIFYGGSELTVTVPGKPRQSERPIHGDPVRRRRLLRHRRAAAAGDVRDRLAGREMVGR